MQTGKWAALVQTLFKLASTFTSFVQIQLLYYMQMGSPEGGGGTPDSHEFWIGVCHEFSWTLTPYLRTKKAKTDHPIQGKNEIVNSMKRKT